MRSARAWRSPRSAPTRLGPRALRASAGAIFRVPLVAWDALPERRIALVAHGGEPLAEADLDSSARAPARRGARRASRRPHVADCSPGARSRPRRGRVAQRRGCRRDRALRAARARGRLAEASAATSAAATATTGEAASTAAPARVRRREGIAEARGKVADGEARRARPEVAVQARSSRSRSPRERLGHVELRTLEDALGDPERDPVDEEALPELRASRAAPPGAEGSRRGSGGTPPSAPPPPARAACDAARGGG